MFYILVCCPPFLFLYCLYHLGLVTFNQLFLSCWVEYHWSFPTTNGLSYSLLVNVDEMKMMRISNHFHSIIKLKKIFPNFEIYHILSNKLHIRIIWWSSYKETHQNEYILIRIFNRKSCIIHYYPYIFMIWLYIFVFHFNPSHEKHNQTINMWIFTWNDFRPIE